MSIGLKEDKKQKPKTMDQKYGKPLSSNEEAATTTVSSSLPRFSSSSIPLIQSEVFDSSKDNAMSEMKKVADMLEIAIFMGTVLVYSPFIFSNQLC